MITNITVGVPTQLAVAARCKATNTRKKPCGLYARINSDYCGYHGPPVTALVTIGMYKCILYIKTIQANSSLYTPQFLYMYHPLLHLRMKDSNSCSHRRQTMSL
jgi:hypothetical protein